MKWVSNGMFAHYIRKSKRSRFFLAALSSVVSTGLIASAVLKFRTGLVSPFNCSGELVCDWTLFVLFRTLWFTTVMMIISTGYLLFTSEKESRCENIVLVFLLAFSGGAHSAGDLPPKEPATLSDVMFGPVLVTICLIVLLQVSWALLKRI